ncbi:MAG: methyltransferase [Verrucomicrobia bacterium]|nr:MAG: methyltransferase [Verrucomicrobiota bacterium]
MTNGSLPAPDRILEMLWGFAPLLIVEAAASNGIFDVLRDGPRGLDGLVEATGSSTRGVQAIADALVGLGFLSNTDGLYRLMPESEAFLTSGTPTSFAPMLRHFTRQLIPGWLQLSDVVREGKPATSVNREGPGSAFFSEFVDSIFPLSYPAARRLGEHLGVPSAVARVSVLDLGAGSGVWGIALAQQSRHVHVRAVDWDRVLEVTARVAARCGVGDRVEGVGGDLLAADFGTEHNIATIGHILHSEGEERSRALLRRVFGALHAGGTVAIQEFLLDETRQGPPAALIFGVNMLVNSDAGRTFAFDEIASWLSAAGFINARLLEVPGPAPLILATKP